MKTSHSSKYPLNDERRSSLPHSLYCKQALKQKTVNPKTNHTIAFDYNKCSDFLVPEVEDGVMIHSLSDNESSMKLNSISS